MTERADYSLQTKYGKLLVVALDATHIRADAVDPGPYDTDSDHEPLTIHGVTYRLRVYLRRTAEGWVLDTTDGLPGLDGRRVDWANYNRIFLSDAAYAKVRDEIVPLLITWAETNPDALRDAELAMLRDRVADHDREIAKLTAEIAVRQAARDTDLSQIKLIGET